MCSKFENIWARSWENESYAICEQQRRRTACASAQSDQRLCCSLPRQNDTSSLYIGNFKVLAGLCSWAGQFVSYLVGDSRRHIFSWRGSFDCLPYFVVISLYGRNTACKTINNKKLTWFQCWPIRKLEPNIFILYICSSKHQPRHFCSRPDVKIRQLVFWWHFAFFQIWK